MRLALGFLRDWHTRALQPVHYLLLAERTVTVKPGLPAAPRLLVLGAITPDGHRHIYDTRGGDAASEADWTALVEAARTRGLSAADSIVSTSPSGMAAARKAFPKASREPLTPAARAKLGGGRWMADLKIEELPPLCALAEALPACAEPYVTLAQPRWLLEAPYFKE